MKNLVTVYVPLTSGVTELLLLNLLPGTCAAAKQRFKLRLLANFNFVAFLLRLHCGCDRDVSKPVSRSRPLPIGSHDEHAV